MKEVCECGPATQAFESCVKQNGNKSQKCEKLLNILNECSKNCSLYFFFILFYKIVGLIERKLLKEEKLHIKLL